MLRQAFYYPVSLHVVSLVDIVFCVTKSTQILYYYFVIVQVCCSKTQNVITGTRAHSADQKLHYSAIHHS